MSDNPSDNPILPLAELPIDSHQSLEEHALEAQPAAEQSTETPPGAEQSPAPSAADQQPWGRRRFLGGMLSGAVT